MVAYSRKISQFSRIYRSKTLSPSPPINNRALCAPTDDDSYPPIIRSRLQPFDAGAPGERAHEGKREYRRQICTPTTVANANRLRQTAIVRAALGSAWDSNEPGYGSGCRLFPYRRISPSSVCNISRIAK